MIYRFKASRIVMAFIVVMVLVTTTVEVGVDNASAQAKSCPECVSAYTLPSTSISVCGFTEIPRSAVTSLPDGGSGYTYDLANGASATIVVPPPGFDPANASSSELATYGIPSQPSSAPALADWLTKYSNINYPTPPADLIETPVEASTVPRTYAGWISDTSSNTATLAYFTQPSASLSMCTGGGGYSLGGIWTGLGGTNTQYLAQDGTFFGSNYPGVSNGQFFFEFAPNPPDENSAGTVNLNTSAAVGDSVETQIAYDGGLLYNVNINDWTSGKAYDVLMTAPSGFRPDGSSAEVIVESPVVDLQGDNSDLPYFTRIAINSSEVKTGGNYVSMDNSSAFYVNMKDAAGLFQATPTQIQSSGNFFVNYQTCK